MTPQAERNTELFPSFDSLERVLWPGLALLVFVATAMLVDVIILLATRWRLVDLPNRRSAHSLPTPRGGGLAIVATTVLATVPVMCRFPSVALPVACGLLLPSLINAATGLLDDLRPLRPSLRLVIQCGVGLLVTFMLGPVSALAVPGLPPLELGMLAWPLTVFWMVGMTNAFNFMDGSDGMAGLAAVVAGAALAVVGLATGGQAALLVAGFTTAAAAGFLVFNWPPARIFMGDVGSGFLGTMLAAIPLLFPAEARPYAMVVAVLCLCPYILDPLVSVARRIWNGHNPLIPHREFFFHRLIRSGESHGRVAVLYGMLGGVGAMAGMLMLDPRIPAGLRGFLPAIVVAAVMLTAAWIEQRCARVPLTMLGTAPATTPTPAETPAAAEKPAFPPDGFYARTGKRVCDLIAAAVLVVTLAPAMVLVAVAVRIILGRPVLFRDDRAGLHGLPIRIMKFRSMSDTHDAQGRLLPDELRLGRFGRFLRRTSLDELPQLFNVLTGDMSIVGPRPLPERYLSRYSPRQASRLLVRPGLTGWAQIHGRNAVAWPERLEYDARYVEMLGQPAGVLVDLWIVGVTAFQILWQAVTGRGVAAPGAATMQEFTS